MTPAPPTGASLEGAGLAIFLLIVVPLALGIVAFLVGRLLVPPKPTPVKVARYEAGNPPHGRARGWLAVQYYPYLLLFLTFEPLAAMLLVLGFLAAQFTVELLALVLVFSALYLPLLYAVVAQSKNVKLWELGARE